MARVIQTPNDIKIILRNIVPTGQTNPENTKNIVNLEYYLLNRNQLVSPEFASDSINLLTDQEMAQALSNEIETRAYIDTKPRTPTVNDQQLWIIGAVLGPLLFLLILFWIIFYVYYKCINPRKPSIKSKSQSTKLTAESPTSVNIMRSILEFECLYKYFFIFSQEKISNLIDPENDPK